MKDPLENKIKKNFKSKNHFLINYSLSESAKIFWPKEIKLAKKLLESFPDLKFWRDYAFTIFDKRPNSLTAYLTSNNFKILSIGYHNFIKLKNLDLKSRKSYTVKGEKIGEDKIYQKKDKNVLDFLRNGKKKEN